LIKALHHPPRCSVFAVTVVSLLFGVFLNWAGADVLDLSSAAVTESSTDGGNPSFVGSDAFDGTTATRWASESSGGAEWLYVVLGADGVLHSVTIDWETANATTYEIRMRTDAQGPAESPGDWTRVATVNGANWLPEGGASATTTASILQRGQWRRCLGLAERMRLKWAVPAGAT
jgi:hypothetical protein